LTEKKTDRIETAETAKELLKQKKKTAFTDKLGIKDAHAGEKTKEAADKTGAIIAVAALVLGFLLWNRLQDVTGFLIGILIAGAGIFIACIIVSVMYSYGDMITMSIEQTRILKALEAKKIPEPICTNPPEQPTTAPVAKLPAEAAEPGLGKAPDNGPLVPAVAVLVDKANRIAQFTGRSADGIICPICGRSQDAAADTCLTCGCKFLFEGESSFVSGTNKPGWLKHLPA
jgi:hypothetical protein